MTLPVALTIGAAALAVLILALVGGQMIMGHAAAFRQVDGMPACAVRAVAP